MRSPRIEFAVGAFLLLALGSLLVLALFASAFGLIVLCDRLRGQS